MAKTKKSIVKKAVEKAKDESDENETVAHEKGESKEFQKGEDEEEKEEASDDEEDGKGGPGKYKNLGKK